MTKGKYKNNGVKHKVVSGETFSGICKKEGNISNWKAALEHPNNEWLKSSERYFPQKEHILIKPGEEVYVPSADEMYILGTELNNN